MNLNIFKSLMLIVCLTLFGACTKVGQNNQSESENTLVIEAEDYTGKQGEVIINDGLAESKSGSVSLNFEIEVDQPGRYEVAVSLKGSGTVWIEDYHDNKDGRTYNISGELSVDSDELTIARKFGSPLNTGKHKIKLHVNGENMSIDKIQFSLMNPHQITSNTLVQSMEGENWNMVWSDEFDKDGAPDTTKWMYDVGNWGWGNNEPQYYTVDRRENARVEDGALIIEARKNDLGFDWTSARLTTRSKGSFLYGKIEFRAKAPAENGTWAAGWLLGDAYRDELSWPYCGEVDVLESIGNEIDDETGIGINHASCHTRTYYFKENTQITNTIEIKDMATEFHTYGIEWTPTEVRAYLDGEHYYTYDKNKDALEWPFDKPQNLIVNLAMGGGMGGNIDPSVESAQFIIDYIRVYELN